MKQTLILAAMMLLGMNVAAQTQQKTVLPATRATAQKQVTVVEAKRQKEATKQQTVERQKQLQEAKRQKKADAAQQKTVAQQKAAAPTQQKRVAAGQQTRAAGTQAKADSLTKGRAKMQQRLRKMNGGRTVSTDTVNGKKVVRPVRHTAKGKAKLTKRPQVGDTVTVNGRKMVVRGS